MASQFIELYFSSILFNHEVMCNVNTEYNLRVNKLCFAIIYELHGCFAIIYVLYSWLGSKFQESINPWSSEIGDGSEYQLLS